MRLLITGGVGQVGEALRRLGPSSDVTVVAPDLDVFDLTKPETLAIPADIDAVVNSGAYTAVDKAESEPALAEAINATGAGVLAGLAADRKIPIVQISTDYVFDGSKTAAYVESDAVNPLSVYGRTKEAGERLVRAANPRHAVLRTSWVYAVHGNNFVKTMLRLGRERDQLRVVADQHGAPTYADDIARAILLVARGLAAGGPAGTFHFTNAGETTWHSFACAIWDRAGPKLNRKPAIEAIPTSAYPTPARRPMNSRLDCSKIAAAYSVPRRPWSEALDEMLGRLLGACPSDSHGLDRR
jgi:dTDP-4-dehydrorhamnose reductase